MTYTQSAMDKLMNWKINISAMTQGEQQQVADRVSEDDNPETVAATIAEVTGRHTVLAQRPLRRGFFSRIVVDGYDYDEDMEFNAPFETTEWNNG